MRPVFFNFLRALYFFINKLSSGFLSVEHRQQLVRWSYKIKAKLFPEYGRNIPDISSIGSPSSNSTWGARPIPEWAFNELKSIGTHVDPALYPTDLYISNCLHYSFPVVEKPGDIYFELLNFCSSNAYTHCFGLPWLKRGGADLVSLRHINLVAESSDAKVLVFLTEKADSPWIDRLPKNVDVIKLGDYVGRVSDQELLIIVLRLLIQIRCDVLHIINSRFFWDLLEKYGVVLTNTTSVYASLYCDDYDRYGRPVGYARDYLFGTYKYLNKVFSDNFAYPKLLRETYGYPSDLFEVIRNPAPNLNFCYQRPAIDQLRVLWAGRLDRQKRPDILLAVAQAMPEVSFTIYGAESIDVMPRVVVGLKKQKNVRMMGAYEGAEALPFSEHHLFLYTSQWDGMPNMVLEAVAAGIPVVASDVGGISDVINYQRGFLVSPPDDPMVYVDRVKEVFNNLEEAVTRAIAAKRHVDEFYNMSVFKDSLIRSGNYIVD